MSLKRYSSVVDDPTADLHDTILSHHLSSSGECRVLIVDDDDLVRARLAALLRMSNFEVEVAGSGEEALRILSKAPCRVVLTDWQMPDMDGLALCRYVRTACYESYIYVVMLTVRDAKQDVLTGLAAGADDYVFKGTPVEEILARIEIGRRITHVEQSLRVSNRENPTAVDHRPAHRRTQPAIPDQEPAEGAGPLPAVHASARDPELRYRRLQTGERSLRASGRRSGAAILRHALDQLSAQDQRLAGAHRRRRIRHRAARDHARRGDQRIAGKIRRLLALQPVSTAAPGR